MVTRLDAAPSGQPIVDLGLARIEGQSAVPNQDPVHPLEGHPVKEGVGHDHVRAVALHTVGAGQGHDQCGH